MKLLATIGILILAGALLGNKADAFLGFSDGTTMRYVIGPALFLLIAYFGYYAYRETRKLKNQLGDKFIEDDSSGP